MRSFLSVCLLLVPLGVVAQEKINHLLIPASPKLPKFSAFKSQARYSTEQTPYGDILNHCGGSNPPITHYDRGINAHESTHRANAHATSVAGDGMVAYYVLDDRVIKFKEPGLRKNLTQPFVPASLRFGRFGNYIVEAPGRDNKATDTFDEWVAYTNELVSIHYDQVNKLGDKTNTDAIHGPLELGIYAVAAAMSVEKNAPEYFAAEPQLIDFVRWQWARTKEICEKSAPLLPWDHYDRMLHNLRVAEDAESMRAFITKYLDGVWLK